MYFYGSSYFWPIKRSSTQMQISSTGKQLRNSSPMRCPTSRRGEGRKIKTRSHQLLSFRAPSLASPLIFLECVKYFWSWNTISPHTWNHHHHPLLLHPPRMELPLPQRNRVPRKEPPQQMANRHPRKRQPPHHLLRATQQQNQWQLLQNKHLPVHLPLISYCRSQMLFAPLFTMTLSWALVPLFALETRVKYGSLGLHYHL